MNFEFSPSVLMYAIKSSIFFALSFIMDYWMEVKLPVDPSCPSVGWSVGRSVCWSVGLSVIISEKGGKLHFNTPVGASSFFFYSQIIPLTWSVLL